MVEEVVVGHSAAAWLGVAWEQEVAGRPLLDGAFPFSFSTGIICAVAMEKHSNWLEINIILKTLLQEFTFL